MVMPGLRGDPRTPGGMPDSGSVNPGGPMPSVPQNRGQSMGAGVSPPDPGKLEELFTQYTSGQISRDDLLSQLHTFSEGQGGILGLLEKSDTTPGEDTSMPSMPGPAGAAGPMPGAMPGAASGTMPGPMSSDIPGQPTTNALGEEIPPLEGPLDERHQHISRLLQEYGLEAHDADQMSSVLNPHVDFNDPQKGHGVTTFSGTQKTETDDAGGVVDIEQEGGAWSGSAEETKSTYSTELTQYEIDREREKQERAADLNAEQEGGAFGPSALDTTQTASDPDLVAEATKYNEAMLAKENTGSIDDWASAGDDILPTPYKPDEVVRPASTLPVVDQTGKYFLADGTEVRPVSLGEKPEVVPASVVPEIKKGVKADISGDMHPAIEGMPNNWGVADKAGKDYNLDHPFADPDGKTWWPTKAAYDLVQEFKKKAFGGGPATVWTKDGEVNAVFLGWQPGTKLQEFGADAGWKGGPIFGAPGSDGLFPVDMANGDTYYFANKADQINFADNQIFPDGSKLEAGKKKPTAEIPPGYYRDKDGILQLIKTTATGQTTQTVFTKDNLPPEWEIVTEVDVDGFDREVLRNKETGEEGTIGADGKLTIPAPPATDQATQYQAEIAGALEMAGASRFEYPALYDAIGQLTREDVSPLANEDVAQTLLTVIASIENTRSVLGEATRNRMFDVSQRILDEKAADARAVLDRDVQVGALFGEMDGNITAARRAEDTARIFEAARQAGQVPVWDSQNEKWMLSEIPPDMENNVIDDTGQLSLEAKMFSQNLTATNEDKIRNYEISLASLFGDSGVITHDKEGNKLPENADVAVRQTLESRKFGLTELLAQAETSGLVPVSWTADKATVGQATMSAKRHALELDLQQQDLAHKTQMVTLEQDRVNNQFTIEENKITLQTTISEGQLAEAVEARKDQTWLASEKLRLDRDKMKLDVLMSLNTPATFLFANRSGLLGNIGAALGIDFGDSVPSSIPSLINPNTIPTLVEFNAATPDHQQMMLVEMASDANIGSMEQAAKMIYEASPGAGRQIRRPSILSASR